MKFLVLIRVVQCCLGMFSPLRVLVSAFAVSLVPYVCAVVNRFVRNSICRTSTYFIVCYAAWSKWVCVWPRACVCVRMRTKASYFSLYTFPQRPYALAWKRFSLARWFRVCVDSLLRPAVLPMDLSVFREQNLLIRISIQPTTNGYRCACSVLVHFWIIRR